ncbi:MAG: DUF3501 family protein [Alphaproteobacteria bacterium]|nr:DUF3501 family protein [Alphaproteobacteria bacterium]
MTVRLRRRQITRADILPLPAYEAVRAQKRAEIRQQKRKRQIGVGPFATFTFETYESMWVQVHEMLRTEKGGDAQLGDELAAYNPLVPNGRELVATMMLEIENAEQRARELAKLGGIENTVRLHIGREVVVNGVPERDVERTDAETGKASSVHFFHFPFTAAQIQAFRAENAEVTLEIAHPRYRHAAGLPKETRQALAEDFDEAVVH